MHAKEVAGAARFTSSASMKRGTTVTAQSPPGGPTVTVDVLFLSEVTVIVVVNPPATVVVVDVVVPVVAVSVS
jgi:hypothetical protein